MLVHEHVIDSLHHVDLGNGKRAFTGHIIADRRGAGICKNLLTFTGYDGFDPELGGGDGASATAMGVDKGIYPQSRTIYIGANVTF